MKGHGTPPFVHPTNPPPTHPSISHPQIEELTPLPDPCPLPATSQSGKRRSLSEKDRLLYAPMSDVGGLLYDADAMYIDIPDWKVGRHVLRSNF